MFSTSNRSLQLRKKKKNTAYGAFGNSSGLAGGRSGLNAIP